ncbi:hypothetical protein [Pseudomonas aeruginosa]|uniref:hypothetical protein n=1 Tax=Pseudomonas aeruginosa TaxID=287 RepID=UPI00065909CB|nr:hypothetical protein [Pseudomonas aeruginosa]OTH75844.1 hypothetical protein CAZ03_31950 [Pseudomonas aeruginosa]CRP50306.1 hypothetical protein PAERUG_P26_Wales_1_VIM_2_11_10_05461 [Pseudomonas aeruginosa]CRP77954.1 hypothetical protein PAERUG_P27_Wales_1_VIM_2_02_11_05337 [Pseudomonas aeruginosa]HCE6046625.1 hypothetical protein [Pseudomonas aeruginosa]HEJ1348987.1 hypothetical protein [Pseudomonas aeruginosa]
MSDMNTLLEIALRDSRNLEVIIALDRLIILPESEAALHAAMKDLETVKSFINTKLPGHLKEYARGLFVQHGRLVAEHYKAKLEAGETAK